MSQMTIDQLAKALNRSYNSTAQKMQKLVEYRLAVQLTEAMRCPKKKAGAIFDLKVPVHVLREEPEVRKVAKEYGIVIEKPPKPTGMSDLSKFCANPFNLGGNHG